MNSFRSMKLKLPRQGDVNEEINAGEKQFLECGEVIALEAYQPAACTVPNNLMECSTKKLQAISLQVTPPPSPIKVEVPSAQKLSSINHQIHTKKFNQSNNQSLLSPGTTDDEGLESHSSSDGSSEVTSTDSADSSQPVPGEKPLAESFKCKYCERTFSYLCHLKVHERVHTGEKPYSCKFCSTQFSQLGSLTVHMRIHTGEKPYQCRQCSKKFRHINSLRRHQRQVHAGQPKPDQFHDGNQDKLLHTTNDVSQSPTQRKHKLHSGTFQSFMNNPYPYQVDYPRNPIRQILYDQSSKMQQLVAARQQFLSRFSPENLYRYKLNPSIMASQQRNIARPFSREERAPTCGQDPKAKPQTNSIFTSIDRLLGLEKPPFDKVGEMLNVKVESLRDKIPCGSYSISESNLSSDKPSRCSASTPHSTNVNHSARKFAVLSASSTTCAKKRTHSDEGYGESASDEDIQCRLKNSETTDLYPSKVSRKWSQDSGIAIQAFSFENHVFANV